jgi:hypothetical protein
VIRWRFAKATLASIMAKTAPGIRFNEHMEGDGPTVFAHACKMGLEGIVSKRKDSAYRSGRSPDWLKMKNPEALAVKRGRRGRLGQKETALTDWASLTPAQRAPQDGALATRSGAPFRVA